MCELETETAASALVDLVSQFCKDGDPEYYVFGYPMAFYCAKGTDSVVFRAPGSNFVMKLYQRNHGKPLNGETLLLYKDFTDKVAQQEWVLDCGRNVEIPVAVNPIDYIAWNNQVNCWMAVSKFIDGARIPDIHELNMGEFEIAKSKQDLYVWSNIADRRSEGQADQVIEYLSSRNISPIDLIDGLERLNLEMNRSFGSNFTIGPLNIKLHTDGDGLMGKVTDLASSIDWIKNPVV